MSTSFDNLLSEQRLTIQLLSRVLTNYRKLGRDKFTAVKTRTRISELEKLWSECRALHVRLQQAASEEDLQKHKYFTNQEFFEAATEYESSKDALMELLPRLPPDTASVAQVNPDDSSASNDSRSICNFALPKIKIPPFNGELTKWEGFRDSFEALINSNSSLSDVQKLYFLKSFLEGNAALLIEHIQISDSNYGGAWEILKEEYDCSRTLIAAHIHSFASFPVMKTESATELKRLRDIANASLSALKNLKRPVDRWDDILVYILVQKLSVRTKREWNLRLGSSKDYPSYSKLIEFITERIRGVTMQEDSTENVSSRAANEKSAKNKLHASVHHTSARKCACCSNNHFTVYCPTFKKKSIDDRYSVARQSRLCFNCLKPGHFPGQCESERRCSKCQQRHNTLLHRDSSPLSSNTATAITASTTSASSASSTVPDPSGAANVHCVSPSKNIVVREEKVLLQTETPSAVLLATAIVRLRTSEGREVTVRALLDQGSSCSFVTESLAQSLRAPRQRANLHVSGFGERYNGVANSFVTLMLLPSHIDNPKFTLRAYVYQRITAYTARKSRAIGTRPHLRDLTLADPDPTSHGSIDLLIGADLYGALLLGEVRKGSVGTPTAQATVLGWIVSGPGDSCGATRAAFTPVLNCMATSDADSLLKRFWEIEEVPLELALSPEDDLCERHFIDTHTRTSSGRYIVRLPFRVRPPIPIGESRNKALTIFRRNESRLATKPQVAAEYDQFLSDYETMGHMERVDDEEAHLPSVYLPHHPVFREGSLTSHLRVVFNASSSSSNGTSLNDHLLTGPKLQRDITAIILNWRKHRFVYIADIAKMFRQILIHHDEADYQRIFWRPPTSPNILPFRLLTVTYGTAPAPFLAMRVLQQLAEDDGEDLPEAVQVLRRSVYVDDVLFGADDLETARKIRNELTTLLNRGGFHLRKWAANYGSMLEDIPAGDHELACDLPFDDNESLKVLGLTWFPNEDCYRFKISEIVDSNPTKRAVLSFIERLFDPLGWASPIIITAKILIQDLWLRKIDWDASLPDDLLRKWRAYYATLPRLVECQIPRWVGTHRDCLALELHGFSDASERAYSAVVYLRAMYAMDDVRVSLLAAKSKVAPLKTVSLPRLELNGALLLVRLLDFIRTTLALENVSILGWTDSTVTLAWIAQHPTRWTTYIANRVSEIQTKVPELKWHHVPSRENPADCASRGISVSEYISHPLWWRGPPWLSKPSVFWPSSDSNVHNESTATSLQEIIDQEARKALVCHSVTASEDWDLLCRYSCWNKLLRVTALVLRFVRVLRGGVAKGNERLISLVEEREIARLFWLKYVQLRSFKDEIRVLKGSGSISKSSSLRSLNPFIDCEGLLRLGGRLQHAHLSYNEKFPILLPRHQVSSLLIAQAHRRSLHGGTQLTLRVLRQQYWILGARSLVRNHINHCVACVRERANTTTQLMGALPPARVTPSPPFAHCGIDYAGPFLILPRVGRGQRAQKYYVAIFVCLATRAVHLEYADDCSTNAFLAAFRRLVSRRGIPSDIYSDNGTNFQGADRELRQAFHAACKNPELHTLLANDGTRWHFIPANAPHFGGLWEAAVKSLKHHLRRVVGAHTLSQSEFATLLCQIEACLNSRPLAAVTDDPEELSALTPAHFLIGRPLLNIPEPSVLSINENRLSRWQHIQAMNEAIWRAWSKDYLHTLHQRSKWQSLEAAVKVNDLVLIKNDQLPPAKWELARIVQTHPGPDGLVRVVTLRTATTTRTRPISKICRLLSD